MSLHDEIIDAAAELAVEGDLRTREEIVDAVSHQVEVSLGCDTPFGLLAEAAYNWHLARIEANAEPVVL